MQIFDPLKIAAIWALRQLPSPGKMSIDLTSSWQGLKLFQDFNFKNANK